MQLTALLSLLVALVSVIHAEPTPVDYPFVRLLGVVVVLAIELSWLYGRLSPAANEPSLDDASRDRFERAWPWFHLAALTAIYGWARFGTVVSVNGRLSEIPLADELVALLPAVLPLAYRWSLLDRSPHAPPRIEWEPVWAATRLFLIPALLPMLILCGWMDVVRLAHWNISPQIHGLAAILGAVVFVAGLPYLMSLLWSAKPLPEGTVRHEVERLIERTGLRFGSILLWDTGERIANAAVTGLVPGKRHLFFTDGLVNRLSEEQLAAVAAHEVAHCQAGHHRRLLLSLAVPLGVLLSLPNTVLSDRAVSIPWILALVAAAGVWGLLHGYLARLLEHEADWIACYLLARADRPDDHEVELLYSALQAADASPRGDWLHPAPPARHAFLRRLAENPHAETEFINRLAMIHRLQLSVLFGLGAVWLYSIR